ncbi:endolytic transglycosylase MltG [Actinokineospora bangkokensis]|uniref:Endolytic murein transglycosylase n=1 Tax=Actinokineospora bangkokensis TaxID=1193682 RepID=A0A1Q9LI25_9PSEU|nr:endolytic transglycosylase MltG [Actinokineospora bangkokensis]OLR91707.1 aminodeoxychorismate lyase [Actinokineospora bangkokensis]
MTDDLGLFADEPDRPRKAARGSKPKRDNRRLKLTVVGLVILLILGGGAWYGYRFISGLGGYDDYSGAGETDLVVEVASGDSTSTIAGTLKEAGVVASTKAFVTAAESDARIRSVQPGYYVMRTKISGQDAVARIVDPKSRVGNLQIKAGTQFDDITSGDNTTPGVLTLISKATCATLNGKSTCVPVAELAEVASTADLAELGVPDWAIPDASRAEPKRRLEGLVMPDVYEVKPGSSALEVWKKLLADSSARLQGAGMPGLADGTGFTPYQVMVMASLVQREAIAKDFGRVARVTYNRLAISMMLQYDSTVNYVLDRPAILTKPEDRAKTGPYNTYANPGLPPTPIAAVSPEALQAAAKPADGTWLYFVRCEKDGTSCFANTLQEHQANIELADRNGAY